jgi:uncharacterized protein YdeI (YjbR/CyaY-like superfamily)
MTKKSDTRIPADISAAFASEPKANRAFRALPLSHQQEYVQWIAAAKKPETRERRILKDTEMVLAKR